MVGAYFIQVAFYAIVKSLGFIKLWPMKSPAPIHGEATLKVKLIFIALDYHRESLEPEIFLFGQLIMGRQELK